MVLKRAAIMTIFLFYACSLGAETVSVPGLVTVKASVKEAPPSWAVKQRHLIKTINNAAPIFLERYTYRGGTLTESRKIDDDYECFNTWPLFYIIGGNEKILDWSLQEFNAITRQWTYQRQQSVYKEFVKNYDMLHLSEGYLGFQYFGLADPTIPENTDRARRFAGFYMNEDPESSANFDNRYKVITSISTGSKGPGDHSGITLFHASLYPFVKKVDSELLNDKKRMEKLQKIYDRVVVPCDIPANMAITGLITHAYLLTGEEKYRKWVLEYIGAWLDRIKQNNGIIPDNIGRTGKIGEYRNGQWWGGLFGWSTRYSIEIMFNGIITSMECSHVLSGDPRYLELLRSQAYGLMDRAKYVDGNLLIPYKYSPEGWTDYRPMEPYILSHLWHESMDTGDWKKIEILRERTKNGPWAYAYAEMPDPSHPELEIWRSDGTVFDWNLILNDLSENKFRRNESPHLSYLGGTNPGWPEKIMDAEYELVCRNVERLRSGTYRHKWSAHDMHAQNPVVTAGLAQMTMGAPFTCFNGGLLRAHVRYFDIDRARPGLPPDIAALVEKVETDRTVLQLVNLNAFETRTLIVQAGAYGEHEFTEVEFKEVITDNNGKKGLIEKKVPINKKFFSVELPPGTSIKLDIGTKRFVNKPTYAFPWHGDKVPVK